MTIKEPDLEGLHQLRSWVFSKAKLWWGFGVTFGYLAIGAVPIAWLVGWQEWAGPAAAVGLAIAGRGCAWRSEGYRKDAEWTIRAIEWKRGIGHQVDTVKLADLKSKYARGLRKHDDSVSDSGYYEVSGQPSHSLLIKMERESAWWTEQLAKKASKIVVILVGVLALVSLLIIALGGLEVEGEKATTIASEVFRRWYGLAICAVILLDTLNLGWKYHRLSVAARESMERLTTLLDRVDDVSVHSLMIAVSDYQSARKEGPLIPDRFKIYHAKSLQRVWDETLSRKGSRG